MVNFSNTYCHYIARLLIMKQIPYFLVFFLLLTLSGCSLEPKVIEPETLGNYYIFCTLAPTFDEHKLEIGKSLPEIMPEPVTDAEVYIRNSTKTVHLTHTQGSKYRDVNRELQIQPGETYYLDIFRDGHKIINGQTTLPGPFDILIPGNGDTVNYTLSRGAIDTLSFPQVKWSESHRAKYYSVNIKIDNDLVEGNVHNTFRRAIFFPDIVPKFSYQDSVKKTIIVPAQLYVFALDSSFVFMNFNARRFGENITDWTREEAKEAGKYYPYWYDKSKINLNGAAGAFNGISMAKIDIFVKIKIDWP